MILQMNTMNKKGLLGELAKCCGSVSACLPDGKWCRAEEALSADRTDRNVPLKLTLQIQQPSDYMRLASFAVGDV